VSDPVENLDQKNKRVAFIVAGIVCSMVILAFASVPLYSLFCDVTGYAGTTQRADENNADVIERNMVVRFNTSTGRDMPWHFKPELNKVSLKVGEDGFMNFIAENYSNMPVEGTAVFNVTPLKVGKYFKKIQCFCFSQQILNSGQKVNMPVTFFIDPAIDEDPNMKEVKTITLSYTFFKTESDELEQALEEFYNTPDA